MTIASVIFCVFMIADLLFLGINIVNLVIDITDSAISRARIRQYRKGTNQNQKTTKQSIEDLTDFFKANILPTVYKLFPSLEGRRDRVQLDKDLKFIGYDSKYTADSFVILSMVAKLLGFIMIAFGIFGFLALNNAIALLLFGITGLIVIFVVDLDFKSAINKKKAILLSSFPDFIRIVSGFLSADMPLVKAVEHSIQYVDEEWEPILKSFVATCGSSGTDAALEKLKSDVNIFEVKEFVSLVRLTLEQGGDVKSSFNEQAQRITEMQKAQYSIKIGKRETLASCIQAPGLLLTMINLIVPIISGMSIF